MICLAAASKNWVIGDFSTNKMPWPAQKDDLAFFKEMTMNKSILVGRKTFDTLPKLKNRTVCCVSRNNLNDIAIIGHGDRKVVHIKELKDISDDAIVCGGAEIYRQLLPKCQELYLTLFNFEIFIDTPIVFPYSRYEISKMFPKNEKIKDIENGAIWKFSKE